MPRDTGPLKSQILSVPKSEGIVASARILSNMPSAQQRSKMKPEGWQSTAWNWFDIIGEFRYSCEWVGNILSKAKLIVLKDGKPVEDEHAKAALAAFFDGPDGQTEMFRMFGINFTVAGEAYIVASEAEGVDHWQVVAATEVKGGEGGQWTIDEVAMDHPLIVRVWRPHPRKSRTSDAPTRAVLNILSEINGLTQHVAAQIDSRLAGAGILLVPSEITFGSDQTATPGAEGEPAAETLTGSDRLVRELLNTMSAAIQDRGNPSALVPIVIQVAGEFVDKIKHLTFWSPLDEKAIELRSEAIRRLALGMDMPPEVLTGTGEMNHWASWQMEEAAIKAHTEPLLTVLTSSLTTGFLQAYMQTERNMDEAEAARYTFGADTAKMRLRPDRSKEALELYDRGVLSEVALLRETGFEDSDLMADKELQKWLLRKVATGSTTPELVEAANLALGVIFPEVEIEADGEPADEETQEARPVRSLEQHPRRKPPVQVDPVDVELDVLTAAGSVMVYRALERAGNRMRNKFGTKAPGVSAAETYLMFPCDASYATKVLEDAWGAPVDEMAASLGIDGTTLAAHLDSYTRTLLIDQKKHTPELLRSYLSLTRETA